MYGVDIPSVLQVELAIAIVAVIIVALAIYKGLSTELSPLDALSND